MFCFSVLRQGLAIQAKLASPWQSCLHLPRALIIDVWQHNLHQRLFVCWETWRNYGHLSSLGPRILSWPHISPPGPSYFSICIISVILPPSHSHEFQSLPIPPPIPVSDFFIAYLFSSDLLTCPLLPSSLGKMRGKQDTRCYNIFSPNTLWF